MKERDEEELRVEFSVPASKEKLLISKFQTILVGRMHDYLIIR